MANVLNCATFCFEWTFEALKCGSYLKNHFSHKGFIGSQIKCFMAIFNPQ